MSETATSTDPASGRRTAVTAPATPIAVAAAVFLDAALVILFAAIGRASHDEGGAAVGTLSTAWPFLVGLSIGWIVIGWLVAAALLRASALPNPLRAWPAGVIAWVCTVAIGMGVRAAAGEGTALTFVLVASAFNLLTLVGWRLLAALAARRMR